MPEMQAVVMQPIIIYRMHAAVQSNIKDEFTSLWEHTIFGYALNKNPIDMKFCTIYCVADFQKYANFGYIPFARGAVGKTAMKWTMLFMS
jgi:hypothetical protein